MSVATLIMTNTMASVEARRLEVPEGSDSISNEFHFSRGAILRKKFIDCSERSINIMIMIIISLVLLKSSYWRMICEAMFNKPSGTAIPSFWATL